MFLDEIKLATMQHKGRAPSFSIKINIYFKNKLVTIDSYLGYIYLLCEISKNYQEKDADLFVLLIE